MRELSSGIFLENGYPGVWVAAVSGAGGMVLIDSPLRTEDAREWLRTLESRGTPRYVVLLDYHPDRVLGARELDLPIVAHDLARQVMSSWPDTFKGGLSPVGSEADRLKRVAGMHEMVPELTFSDEMKLVLGEREVILRHAPGPTPASICALVAKPRLAFIGDLVTLNEPPFLSDAELGAWQGTLDWLRSLAQQRYGLLSSRDGKVSPEEIARMAAWLKRLSARLTKMAQQDQPSESIGRLAVGLLDGFRVPAARREQALLRLRVGLEKLYSRIRSEAF